MGNQLVCCRKRWITLLDSDEQLDVNFSPTYEYVNEGATISQPVPHPRKGVSQTILIDEICCNNRYLSPNYAEKIQHISEREPEDLEFDPSLNASKRSLFHSVYTHETNAIHEAGSVNCQRKSSTRRQSETLSSKPVRWSSCSTIYVGNSCLSRPEIGAMLRSISIAVSMLMQGSNSIQPEANTSGCANVSKSVTRDVIDIDDLEDEWNRLAGRVGLTSQNADRVTSIRMKNLCSNGVSSDVPLSPEVYHDVFEVFDERLHPLMRSKHGSTMSITSKDPEQVYCFLRGLFLSALLGPECAIVALILLERLVNCETELCLLFPWSWRRQLLACLLIASKVLDDQAVWNVDYCQFLSDVTVDDLNLLERHTLRLLQFNINVPAAVYARYYFDLLAVGQMAGVANRPSDRQRLTPALARLLRLRPDSHLTDHPPAGAPWPPLPGCATRTEWRPGLLFDLPNSAYDATDEPNDSGGTVEHCGSGLNATTTIADTYNRRSPVRSLSRSPLGNAVAAARVTAAAGPKVRNVPIIEPSAELAILLEELDLKSEGRTLVRRCSAEPTSRLPFASPATATSSFAAEDGPDRGGSDCDETEDDCGIDEDYELREPPAAAAARRRGEDFEDVDDEEDDADDDDDEEEEEEEDVDDDEDSVVFGNRDWLSPPSSSQPISNARVSMALISSRLHQPPATGRLLKLPANRPN